MTRPVPRPDDPFTLSVEDLPPPEAAGPAEAPPPPDDLPAGTAMVAATTLAARSRSRGLGWFWSALGLLVTLMVSIAAHDYVLGLLERNRLLGAAALALMGILLLSILVQIVREIWAFRRLARIDGFRRDAAEALASPTRGPAEALSARLADFYGARPDIRWAAQTLAEDRAGLLDADAVLALTERALFAPLDAAARREIEAASRTVAGATALIPMAMADVLTALSMNLRMIRRIAHIYGAHAGFFGSWRLFSSVAQHLLATGAVAVGDDLIHSVAGGSVLARVSRRFGEGIVNGALTARVGIAAMEVCRPLPFAALPRPRVSNLIGRSLTGLFSKPSS